MSYTVFTKDNCPNCEIAKSLLSNNNIEYSSIKLGEDIPLSAFKEKYPNVRSAPFILNGDEIVGGLAELRTSLQGA